MTPGMARADAWLGDNPFLGVDHLMKSRARERMGLRTPDRMARVLDAALGEGARGYVCHTHPQNLRLFDQLKATRYQRGFDLSVILPYAYGYVRQATQGGMRSLPLAALGAQPWRRMLDGLRLLSSFVLNDPLRGLRAFVDLELRPYLRAAPSAARVSTIFLHEIVTDLALAFDTEAVLRAFADHIGRAYGLTPGFVTRNFPRFVEFAEAAGLQPDRFAVMTPFNRLGFQMTPSRTACEESLARSPSVQVVAMSTLAAGSLALGEALEYLASLPRSVSVVVGTGDPEHARITFAGYRSALR